MSDWPQTLWHDMAVARNGMLNLLSSGFVAGNTHLASSNAIRGKILPRSIHALFGCWGFIAQAGSAVILGRLQSFHRLTSCQAAQLGREHLGHWKVSPLSP